VFNIAVPVPLFDRQREPRARATARILAAETQLRLVEADVQSELESAWLELEAKRRTWRAVAGARGDRP
jgi:outer membrane protein TolC